MRRGGRALAGGEEWPGRCDSWSGPRCRHKQERRESISKLPTFSPTGPSRSSRPRPRCVLCTARVLTGCKLYFVHDDDTNVLRGRGMRTLPELQEHRGTLFEKRISATRLEVIRKILSSTRLVSSCHRCCFSFLQSLCSRPQCNLYPTAHSMLDPIRQAGARTPFRPARLPPSSVLPPPSATRSEHQRLSGMLPLRNSSNPSRPLQGSARDCHSPESRSRMGLDYSRALDWGRGAGRIRWRGDYSGTRRRRTGLRKG